MAGKMIQQIGGKPAFHVGDAVSFAMGTRRVTGVVVEDRGPIGMGGRRLYDVRFQNEWEGSEPQYIELPAVDLQRELTDNDAVKNGLAAGRSY